MSLLIGPVANLMDTLHCGPGLTLGPFWSLNSWSRRGTGSSLPFPSSLDMILEAPWMTYQNFETGGSDRSSLTIQQHW